MCWKSSYKDQEWQKHILPFAVVWGLFLVQAASQNAEELPDFENGLKKLKIAWV